MIKASAHDPANTIGVKIDMGESDELKVSRKGKKRTGENPKDPSEVHMLYRHESTDNRSKRRSSEGHK